MNFIPPFLRKPWVILAGIAILTISASTYIRMYPLWGHIWSETNEQAALSVVFNIKKNFLNELHQKNPQMSFEEADRIATARMNQTLHDNSAQVRKAIEKVNNEFYASNKTPQPIYLLESDPFYFYNLTENILTKGKIADTIKGHEYFNPLMGAPFGYWQPLSLHPYVGLLIYKIAQLFNPHITLMAAVAFTPLVITAFCIGAFTWCARIFGLSYPAILCASFFFCMAPVFLKRSSLGWYDTDPYNLLFPLLFLIIFFKSINKSTLWAGVLLGLTLLAFSLIWQGWIFLFFMSLICAVCISAHTFFIQKNKAALAGQGAFIGASILTLVTAGSAIYGFGNFLTFFTQGEAELAKFTVKGMNLWPNLFLEVGELKRSTIKDIINDTGNPFLLIIAFTGLFQALHRSLKNLRNAFFVKTLILCAFLAVSVVLTLKAQRFIIFTLPPLAFFFGFSVDSLINRCSTKYQKLFAAPLVTIGMLLICCFGANQSIRTVLTPIFNNTWNDALTAVKNETPADSIINTWWPPGHFIKGIAKRRVPFDGASLSEGAVGYWMANALLSTDENKSRGIFRMLNLSGNRAVDFLTKQGLKTSQAVALIHLITAQTTSQAKETLKPYFNNDIITQLLGFTHGGNPHSYVLVYNELVDDNIGLVFTAHRDFAKIEAINANPQLLASVPAPNSKEFIDFLWNLSGGPSKYSDALSLITQNDDTLSFSENVNIKKDMSLAIISSIRFGQGIPKSIVYLKDGQLIEHEFPNSSLNYSIVLTTIDGHPSCRLMDTFLAKSLLIRLFFFDGSGLQNFRMIKSAHDMTRRTQIKIFELLWN